MPQVWHTARRPSGELQDADFELRQMPDQPLGEGEVRVRNTWLSVDPYVRGLLDDEGSYMPTMPLGSPVPGGAVGEVVESRDAALPIGTVVLHDYGWRDSVALPAEQCRPISASEVPAQRFLGHMGMPGQTAYFGLLAVLEPRAGEVLFVSAAAGAVGTAVVQIAKLKGLHVIASAGGSEKCALLKELGADVVIDRKAPGTMREKLAAAAPDGIDLYFDNVGGDHLDAALESARIGTRISLCGMISGYGLGGVLELPDPMRLVVRHIQMRGFTAPQFDAQRGKFESDMLEWIQAGLVRSPETVLDGLPAMPEGLRTVLRGGNTGKLLIRL
jgi:NADPH-dependent curcumin reductase CurA